MTLKPLFWMFAFPAAWALVDPFGGLYLAAIFCIFVGLAWGLDHLMTRND